MKVFGGGNCETVEDAMFLWFITLHGLSQKFLDWAHAAVMHLYAVRYC